MGRGVICSCRSILKKSHIFATSHHSSRKTYGLSEKILDCGRVYAIESGLNHHLHAGSWNVVTFLTDSFLFTSVALIRGFPSCCPYWKCMAKILPLRNWKAMTSYAISMQIGKRNPSWFPHFADKDYWPNQAYLVRITVRQLKFDTVKKIELKDVVV